MEERNGLDGRFKKHLFEERQVGEIDAGYGRLTCGSDQWMQTIALGMNTTGVLPLARYASYSDMHCA